MKYDYQTVSRTMLGDLHTPVSTYLKVRDIFPQSALMESSDYHGSENNRSFIGLCPVASVSIDHAVAVFCLPDGTREEHPVTEEYHAENALRDFLNRFHVEGEYSDYCGLYGYTSFNAVRYFENIAVKDSREATNDAPDILIKAYEILRFSATNSAIAYFEEQVRLAKTNLNKEEDNLMHYNVEHSVINYDNQSKELAVTKYNLDDREELAQRTYKSAVALRQMLEDKMDIRAKIIRDNTKLLKELEKVTELNQNILEQEIFSTDTELKDNEQLQRNKTDLQSSEDRISHISDNLNEYNFTKEGVGIDNMVTEWLMACINEAKTKAELKVLQERRNDILNQYREFAPVGTQVKRKERAIGIAEDTYREQLRGLSEARLRLQNIKMTTANLQIIAPPEFPLTDNGRKRLLYVVAALIGSLIFITFYFLIIELTDRTLRDAERSHRLSGLPVIAAFNGISNLKFRGFLKVCNRRAAAYSCHQLDRYLATGRPTVINLLSMEEREGKSFLAKYFADHWASVGLRTRIVKHDVDFETNDKKYVRAQQLSDFWQLNSAEQIPDIILVEYPSISTASLPLTVLKQADVNLLIANACRLWGKNDDINLKSIKEMLGDTPLSLYLNNADREVVESFTGELPPKTPLHSFVSRLSQLGLTAKKAAVK